MAEPVQQNPNIVQSETSRQLADVSTSGTPTSVSIDIPKDTVIKRIACRVVAYTVTTFASGSPIGNELGIASLLTRMEVVAEGNRTIKSIHPYMQRMINLLTRGEFPERAYLENGSSARLATKESENGAAFVYGTTTQNLLINESFDINFELPWAYRDTDRMASLFNTKGLSSAFLKSTWGSAEGLQRYESSPAPVVYTETDVKLYSSIIEAQSVPADQTFFDHKESFSSESFSSQTTRRQVKLSTGNLFCGLGILVKNGDANKLLSDKALTDIELRINGQRVLHQTNFLQLQQRMRARLGLRSPKTTGAHNLKGFAFLNLLNGGMVGSALNTAKSAGVDSLDLYVSTAAASGNDAATYTNPVEMIYSTVELSAPPAKV